MTAARADWAAGALDIPGPADARAQWQACLGAMPIIDHLGAALDLSDRRIVRLALVTRTPAHEGGLGTDALNGAIIAGLIDCAMSVTGILHMRGRTCGTVQMSIQFMKPVRTASPVVECVAMRRSSSVVFVEAQLIEGRGRCSVLATGVVAAATLALRASGRDGRSNWSEQAALAVLAGQNQTAA
ncbi:PaaI family thioesterase [Burkholderia sp. MBR-1]|uniref:PaaI family thioesterase n=1 Tax=Burkholderia sp. MBR-1 TaxID=2732364 RepID=UPI0015EF832D|nr:PaaI family thioesterase [Burkholderia sp. MBR-1]QMI49060.1 PaaI family thioesterase [Burkholderia sp. MBR-1]